MRKAVSNTFKGEGRYFQGGNSCNHPDGPGLLHGGGGGSGAEMATPGRMGTLRTLSSSAATLDTSPLSSQVPPLPCSVQST